MNKYKFECYFIDVNDRFLQVDCELGESDFVF